MDENMDATHSSDLLDAYRAKYWSEITPDEKIERLREQVKFAAATIERLQEAIARLTSVFPQHQHGPNGDVLVRAMDTNSSVQQTIGYGLKGMARRGEGDDVYF